MKITELLNLSEGAMKRSNAYISGDSSSPSSLVKTVSKISPARRMLMNAASKTGKNIHDVERVFDTIKGSVNPALSNYWAIVNSKFKREVGLAEERTYREKTLATEDGELNYVWKTDLEDEEYEGYIPNGYSKKVLELSMIRAHSPGNGHGHELMTAFLNTPEARKAELIFLDLTPGIGANSDSSESEEAQTEKLRKFYERYGFRGRNQSQRMWLVKVGSIADNDLPG